VGPVAAQVIVVGALKGGVGKSRLAVMMALYLASLGRSVHLIDGDTISQTTWKWHRRAAKADGWPAAVAVARHPFDDIDEHIDEHAVDVDYVVADIGGGQRSVFEAALTRAHRLLVPIGADPSEAEQLPATWTSAKDAASRSVVGGFEAYVVLSRTDHQTTLPREAREQLADQYPLCDTELVKRVAYQRAYPTVPTDFLDVPVLLDEIGLVKTRG
jgi:cellulose biosynthesis protein BcsQ